MKIAKLKPILKKCPIIVKAYHQFKKCESAILTADFSIGETTKIIPRIDKYDNGELRINLVVPSVNQIAVFGGIATAIRFFEEMSKQHKYEVRIISSDSTIDMDDSVLSNEYEVVSSDIDSYALKQAVAYCDRIDKTIPVRRKDIFIATAWWTAYILEPVVKWQAHTYQQELVPLIYFIQDYEPGFYPWSSRYLMADSTYRMEIPTYAIFNTKILKEFFEKGDYQFTKSWYFDPVINKHMKKYLPHENQEIPKKKQMIIYGRPSVARNAFEIIIAALKIWVQQQPDAIEWKLYSAGEIHDEINLGCGIQLCSLGKLTLEEYAKVLLETYVGIALMVSPHPSYPPLEMSTFGLKTITNTYSNKDISLFNENIFSLHSASPYNIAKQLTDICTKYSGTGTVYVENEYVLGNEMISYIADSIYKIVKNGMHEHNG